MIKEIRLESSRFNFKIMIIVLFNKEKLINRDRKKAGVEVSKNKEKEVVVMRKNKKNIEVKKVKIKIIQVFI
jgi:hypothetical protein